MCFGNKEDVQKSPINSLGVPRSVEVFPRGSMFARMGQIIVFVIGFNFSTRDIRSFDTNSNYLIVPVHGDEGRDVRWWSSHRLCNDW